MSETSAFAPANDLERSLANAKSGVSTVPAFLIDLARSQVVLLVDKEVGEVWDNSAKPLVLTTQEGGPGLCVFTAQERAAVWLHRFPEYEYALTADFIWVLNGVHSGTAILINPGWDEGLVIAPHGVEELKRLGQEG